MFWQVADWKQNKILILVSVSPTEDRCKRLCQENALEIVCIFITLDLFPHTLCTLTLHMWEMFSIDVPSLWGVLNWYSFSFSASHGYFLNHHVPSLSWKVLKASYDHISDIVYIWTHRECVIALVISVEHLNFYQFRHFALSLLNSSMLSMYSNGKD